MQHNVDYISYVSPAEVARTRLREQGFKYKKFWQTLFLVLREEGWRAWYKGLGTQLVRQIPNTAIMMSTYEAVVYLLTKDRYYDDDDDAGEVYLENDEDN